MTTFLITLTCIYTALVLFMAVYQRKLMYFPDRNIQPPVAYGLQGFEDVRAATADGRSVQLWHRPAADGFPTIVYYHGNAGHIGNRAHTFDALTRHGFGLLALSYGGYGKSEGGPSETGIYADARAAIAYVKETLRLPLSRVMLYGESLGSGVAVQMATEYPVGGVVLEAPYTSVAGRAAEIYFYIPVKLLIRDRFDSLSKAPGIKAPLLLFHGELDATIPVEHGRKLLAAVTSPKKGFFFPHVNHNDFDTALISSHVLAFAKEHRIIAQ